VAIGVAQAELGSAEAHPGEESLARPVRRLVGGRAGGAEREQTGKREGDELRHG
jgi:hypothetical protein